MYQTVFFEIQKIRESKHFLNFLTLAPHLSSTMGFLHKERQIYITDKYNITYLYLQPF